MHSVGYFLKISGIIQYFSKLTLMTHPAFLAEYHEFYVEENCGAFASFYYFYLRVV